MINAVGNLMYMGDLMVSLSNHEVGSADQATASWFDELTMRSTANRWWGRF